MNSSKKASRPVRVRFAPSPTGKMHIGGLRSYFWQWLFARQMGGRLILRIEDTDQTRLVKGATRHLLEGLLWLNLLPDEGVTLRRGRIMEVGRYGPYTQSARRARYAQVAERLITRGHAYRCFATKKELEQMRAKAQAAHQPPRYDGRYRDLNLKESAARAASGEPFVIRLKMPRSGKITAHDAVYGEIHFNYAEFDDHIIIKSDGMPTYHFASVVDDHDMKISHVFRGEEWVSSWPRHLATYEALGWTPPAFIHLPVIIGPDHQKLSKRHGAATPQEYQKKGYLPEALLNYLALLGWNPKTTQELFLRDELVAAFDVKGINKANPIFDPVKLDYLNGIYLRDLTVAEVTRRARPWLNRVKDLKSAPPARLRAAVATVQSRAKTLAEIPALIKFYFVAPRPSRRLIPFKKQTVADCARLLDWAVTGLTELTAADWNEDLIERLLRDRINSAGVGAGEILWPVRAALTGEPTSPGAFEVAAVLGRRETLRRLRAAVTALKR